MRLEKMLYRSRILVNLRKSLVSIVFVFTALLFSYEGLANTIRLDGSSTLNIKTDQRNITSIVLMYGKKFQESVKIGNSLPGQVKLVSLCPSCEKLYVVSIPDASSTYGAQTVVVVFPEAQSSWRIQKLPTSTKVIKAQNGEGYVLQAGFDYYVFKDGFLIRLNDE